MLCVLEVTQEIAMAFSTQMYYSVGWYQLFYFQYTVLQIQNIILYHTQIPIQIPVLPSHSKLILVLHYNTIPTYLTILVYCPTLKQTWHSHRSHTHTHVYKYIYACIYTYYHMASKFCSRKFP